MELVDVVLILLAIAVAGLAFANAELYRCIRQVRAKLAEDFEQLRQRCEATQSQLGREISRRVQEKSRQDRMMVLLQNAAGLKPEEFESWERAVRAIADEINKVAAKGRQHADNFGGVSETDVLKVAHVILRATGQVPSAESLRPLVQETVRTSFTPRSSRIDARTVTRTGERTASGQSVDRNTGKYEEEEEPSAVTVILDHKRLAELAHGSRGPGPAVGG